MEDAEKVTFPIQVSDTVRIDKGPRIVAAKASSKTLSDAVTPRNYRVGAIDAFGKKIEMGKLFHYVDWLAGPEKHIFTVYQHDGNRYQIVERYDTEAEARAAADELVRG